MKNQNIINYIRLKNMIYFINIPPKYEKNCFYSVALFSEFILHKYIYRKYF